MRPERLTWRAPPRAPFWTATDEPAFLDASLLLLQSLAGQTGLFLFLLADLAGGGLGVALVALRAGLGAALSVGVGRVTLDGQAQRNARKIKALTQAVGQVADVVVG
jgi:hypothetical protein